MGKYMRKSKSTAEVLVMEPSQHQHQSPLFLGIRTRAKTLALKRLGISSPEAPASDGSYLQLRSRRLEKRTPTPRIGSELKRGKKVQNGESPVSNPNPNYDSDSKGSLRLKDVSVDSGSVFGSGCRKEEEEGDQFERENDVVDRNEEEIQEKSKSIDVGIQASCGENVLDFEEIKNGNKREAAPCSLLRDPDAIRTPSSTTRPGNSAEDNGVASNSMPIQIRTAHDVDEFFSGAETQQQKQFIEKYNFDPVSEKPLPGRYEWVKVDP